MVAPEDLWQAGKLVALAAVTCATPPRYWRRIAEAGVSRDAGKTDPCRQVYRRALGISDEGALDALGTTRRICRHEAKMQVMGLAGPWRNWRPTIRLNGEEHLRAALVQGNGVILWASAFLYNHLVFKMALHQAGYRATQLSRPAHGFGRSPVLVRLLNPVWMRVEERFLGERVLIRGDKTGPALRALRSRLAGNGVVVITVARDALRTVEAPFLEHRIRLAAGPVNLAQSSGAALLPAFVVRNAEGVFEATIEQPLPVPPASEGRESFPDVVATLARRIEHYVRRYPEQWGGWSELIPVDGPAGLDGAGAVTRSMRYDRPKPA